MSFFCRSLWNRSRVPALLLGLFVAGISVQSTRVVQAANSAGTHKQISTIDPKDGDKKYDLNTFALGPDGNLWLCCTDTAPIEGEYSPEQSGNGVILIKQPTGETVKRIPLEFAPQAINFAEDGTAYLAGSGKVAHLNIDGTMDKLIKAPNLLDDAEMKKKLEAMSKKMVAQVSSSYTEQIKRLDEQIASLQEEAKKIDESDERALKRNKSRTELLEQQKSTYAESLKSIEESYSQMFGGDAGLEQVKRATGIAVGKNDVFVSLPSLEGFGYAVYRLDRNLENAKLIKDDLGGCCGQLDIQTDGTDLLVAENTAFRVGRYDRDGKDISGFGERKKDGNDGWGSCCNPMNIRCLENGEILTAESSIGDIKRYSKSGEYLGKIGNAKISGGCKHVAVHFDTKRDWYYLMNEGLDNITVLGPRDSQGETEEEKTIREAREGLGKKLVGAWRGEPDKVVVGQNSEPENPETSYTLETFGIAPLAKYMHLHTDGHFSITEPKPAANSASLFDTLKKAVGIETSSEQVAYGSLDWEPVKQTGDTLEIMVISEGVRSYGATIHFVSDNELHVKWYYDNPAMSLGKPIRYVRIEGPCCQDGKPCTECAGRCNTEAKPAASAAPPAEAAN